MKFLWTTIYVCNLDRSATFYAEILGLPITRRFVSGTGREIAFLGKGETQVELIQDPSLEEISFGDHISVGFETESLDSMMQKMSSAGIPIEDGPIQPNDHIRFFYIRDPDGLKIQIAERF